jgi:hypothetical protein
MSVTPHEWRFAKTMPDNPHEYTLKKTWSNPADFEYDCQLIRTRGKKRKFNGSTYIELDLGQYTYWTMGWPCRPKPGYPAHSATELINRKRTRRASNLTPGSKRERPSVHESAA